jgi:hypothetical protein
VTQRSLVRYLISATLVVAGLIHLLPLSGVLSSERLASLYGLSFSEPNLAILMRHRAVLFGLLGLFLILAAFLPMLRTAAFIAGLISVGSFLGIAAIVGNYNDQIGRVVTADVIALVCLLVGFVAHCYVKNPGVTKHAPDVS